MNFSNIWKHPKTPVVGVLLGVVQIGMVLAHAGLGGAAGTWIAAATAISTILLGALAKDPGASTGSVTLTSRSSKMLVWALIVLLVELPWMTGCTKASVAQDIVNWTPALEGAVATVDSTAALLDPGDSILFATVTGGFDAASNLLVAQAKAYLANPNQSTLALLQTEIVTFQQQVNAALLSAAKIVNPASQAHALNVIQGVATIANAILALVESLSTSAQAAAMSSRATVKLAQIAPLINWPEASRVVGRHYDTDAGLTIAEAGYCQLQQAGF